MREADTTQVLELFAMIELRNVEINETSLGTFSRERRWGAAEDFKEMNLFDKMDE